MTNNTAFDRFQYNFDSTKFGSAGQLSDAGQTTLNAYANSVPMATWQKTDLANGPVDRKTYYKNPISSSCMNLVSSLETLNVTVKNTTFSASGAATVASHLTGITQGLRRLEVQALNTHANNISGVGAINADPSIPTLDGITAMGNQLIMLLNKTDGISNTVGAMGAMTSLFLQPDLDSYSANVLSYNTEIINNSTYGGLPPANTCSLSAARLEQMNTALNIMKDYLYSRRNGDYTFYQTGLQVVMDFTTLNRFSNMSDSQKYLVNNYIGSDSLKAKLASANT
jgi:hypothetical protein